MAGLRVHLSERQQVVLILLFTVAALVGVWAGVLRPQYERRRDIASLRDALARSSFAHLDIDSLRATATQTSDYEKRLQGEWKDTVDRLATFANQAALRRSKPYRIDYKLGLYEARARLAADSAKLGIQLIPQDLGLDEALGGTPEEVRTRVLQLRAVEKLAELTLNRRIQRLYAIAPLPPVHHTTAEGKPLLDEYPVQVEFDVAFDDLFLLFQAIFEEHQVFVFRNLRLESGTTPSSPLRIKAVMSALLFD